MYLKHFKFILFTLMITVSVLALNGCGDDSSGNDTASCIGCHSETSTTGMALLFAQAGYENSGHWLGPRTLDPDVLTTGHMYIHHGSNAAYCAESCHNHEAFIASLSGTTNTEGYPSPPGCFTCHAPHTNGDFALRTTSAVTLKDGTSFDIGTGNLCVACHMANYVATDHFVFSTATTSLASYRGPHHGTQADILVGANAFPWTNATAIANGVTTNPTTQGGGDGTYLSTGDHESNISNSCVQCHMYSAAGDNDSLALGGHGFYLTGEVHGSSYDLVASCQSTGCHPSGWPAFGATFAGETNHTASSDWDGDTTTEGMVNEISGMIATLVSYYGDGTTNFGGDGNGPIVDSAGADQTTGSWNKEWVIQTATFTQVQAASFWNFRLALEDRSGGVHNATYVAQLLWDAIRNLNDNAAAGLTLGATRP
jgi:hypothetical protein